jgi:tetrahydromethanopterin S-methyltransferase subunit D
MAGNPLTDPTWAADLADTVERVVGQVRDKATKPAVHITRGIVYGLLAGLLGIVALTLLLIGATRALQVLLALGLSQDRAVYLSYLIVGGILCLARVFFLRKRHSTDQ